LSIQAKSNVSVRKALRGERLELRSVSALRPLFTFLQGSQYTPEDFLAGKHCEGVKAFFVIKRLGFGSGIKTWRHVKQLQELGITHVINLRFNRHGKKVKAFKSLWLPFKDDKQPRPRWFYQKAWKFHGNAMRQPGSKVCIVCRLGICRSASLTYFLLRSSRKSDQQAYALIGKVRPAAVIGKKYRTSAEAFVSKINRDKRGSPQD
jgi:protein-tyrosine phosphatase